VAKKQTALTAAWFAFFFFELTGFHEVFVLLAHEFAAKSPEAATITVRTVVVKTALLGFDLLAAGLEATLEAAQHSVKRLVFLAFNFNHGDTLLSG
jgi:hypothetical protein